MGLWGVPLPVKRKVWYLGAIAGLVGIAILLGTLFLSPVASEKLQAGFKGPGVAAEPPRPGLKAPDTEPEKLKKLRLPMVFSNQPYLCFQTKRIGLSATAAELNIGNSRMASGFWSCGILQKIKSRSGSTPS